MIRTKLDAENILHVCRNMRDLDREEVFAVSFAETDEELADNLLRIIGSFSFCMCTDDGEPTVLIGAVEGWPGFWSFWMIATPRFPEIYTDLTKWAFRGMLRTLFDDLGLRRGEAQSLVSHETAHRWMERLGAVREGYHPQYGKNGEDFVTYVWTRENRHVLSRG